MTRSNERVWAAAVCVVSWLLIYSSAGDVPLAGDSARDFLFAKDCVVRSECHTLGVKAAFADFYQTSVWYDFISAIEFLGGSYRTVQLAVISSMAVAAGLLWLVATRFFGVATALVTCCAYVLVSAAFRDHTLLWNHSMVGPASIGVFVALLVHARLGTTVSAAAAGVWAGFAIGFHIGASVLLPAVALVVLMASRRPAIDVVLAAGLPLALLWTLSRETVHVNIAATSHGPYLAGALAGALAVAVIAGACRRRWRGFSWGARFAVLASTIIVPFVVAAGVLSLGFDFSVRPKYVYPVLPAALLVSAEIGRRGVEWLARKLPYGRFVRLGVPVAAAVVALQSFEWRRDTSAPTFSEAQAVASHLYGAGYSYAELKAATAGPYCYELLHGLAVYAPPPRLSGFSEPRAFLAVRLDDGEVVPADARATILETSYPSRMAVRHQESWVDRRAGEICLVRNDNDPLCFPVSPDPREALDQERFFDSARSYPEFHPLMWSGRYAMSFAFPLTPSGDDRSRRISLLDKTGRCGWMIEEVDGVPVEGHLPGTSIVLLRQDQRRPGPGERRIVFSRTFGQDGCPPAGGRFPPCFAETGPADVWWRGQWGQQ